MVIPNYTNLIKVASLYRYNLYNITAVKSNYRFSLTTTFNTFKNEKNLKITRLFKLLFFSTGQRPFLRVAKFSYLKKKILKRFFFNVDLNKKNFNNFVKYFVCFYLYFFHMYYQNKIKYNYWQNIVSLYIDNIQYFFKNYIRYSQGTQIKIALTKSGRSNNTVALNLESGSNFFMFKIKKK